MPQKYASTADVPRGGAAYSGRREPSSRLAAVFGKSAGGATSSLAKDLPLSNPEQLFLIGSLRIPSVALA